MPWMKSKQIEGENKQNVQIVEKEKSVPARE